MPSDRVEALRLSVSRLHELTAQTDENILTSPAYPSEWSIADVLSHVGSGAVIMRRRLEDTVAGRETPDDFAPGVWNSWNAKTPVTQRDDALIEDARLLASIQGVTAAQRDAFNMAMGPMTLDFEAFVGMRLNEHGLHTWDVEVATNPAATVLPQAAAEIVDNLEMVARRTAKPNGSTASITVSTTEPSRSFTIALNPDEVVFSGSTSAGDADVEITAEAFIRLVYGRLDPDHTPAPVAGDRCLDVLRAVFPGF